MAFDLWNLRCGGQSPIDPYPWMRPLLFRLDPEDAHGLTLRMLRCGLGPKTKAVEDPLLRTTVFGLSFPNPVGLAAGLDKQAEAIEPLFGFGFGFLEIGGVTPRPQPGNPRPRMFRVPEMNAVINRFGFNGVGVEVFAARVRAWAESSTRTRYPVGVNLGKNKDTTDDAADYIASLVKVAPWVDFVTVNVSSPNTPGLRALQGRERMAELLSRVMAARAEHAPSLPVLIKIAPDLDEAQQDDIAAVVLQSGVQGLIVGNTTVSRPAGMDPALAKEAGGLSGAPLTAMSTALVKRMYGLTKGQIPIVGCGGVATGADAYAKIRAGASLVQVYTALVYHGPLVVRRIADELAALLKRDGYTSVADAVGVDAR